MIYLFQYIAIFDLIFYKDEIDSKYIKCNIIIIINDFDIIKELEENKEESITKRKYKVMFKKHECLS